MEQGEVKKGDGEITGVAIPIHWNFDKDIPTIYANQLLITHMGGEFYLIFGEVDFPVTYGIESDEVPDVLKVNPVAKVVVTPSNMKLMSKFIQINLDNYKKKINPE
jgi:hypothetical protein